MRVKCSSRSIPKRSSGFVRACFKFLGIELETVWIPIGPGLRPIFALYCGTASAQGAGRNQSKLSKRRILSRVLSGFLLKWMSACTIFTPLYGSTLQRRSAGAPIYSSWIYSCSVRTFA
jgi:hypothetical protein